MQSFVAAGAVLAAAVHSVAAAPAPAGPAGVVQWDVSQSHPVSRLGRRDNGAVTETLINNLTRGGYFVTAKIGTPPQELTLLLDTGSSDFWVPDASAEACIPSKSSDGCSLGSFDPDASSTFTDVDEGGFDISYVDQTGSSGDYFTDNVILGDAKLKNFTMGLGLKTTVPFGIIGVGFASGEAVVDEDGDGQTTAYANLPIAMKKAGLINSVAYSLWLNDLDASTGNILFGGVDSEKYTGHLTILDMIDNGEGVISDFRVPLTAVTAASSTGSDKLTSAEYPIGAILDSGTTLAYVPNDLAEQIWKEAGAVYESDVKAAVLPCSRATSGGTFTFEFGGPGGASITVGMDELVLQHSLDAGAYFTDGIYKGEDACQFGIQNSTFEAGEDNYILLGDTVLRSAYIVYDLINKQVGLAQTDFNSTKTNIQTFASLGATIPDGTPAPSQSSLATASGVVATPTSYVAEAGFSSTATGTAVANSGSTSGSTGGASSKSAAGAIAVPTGLLHAGLLSAMMFVAGGMLLL